LVAIETDQTEASSMTKIKVYQPSFEDASAQENPIYLARMMTGM
jgi:hypothetical protein